MLFIFDMGGVVTNTFKFDRMYEKLGIDGDTFYKICASDGEDIKHLLDIGEITVKEFWKIFNERTKGESLLGKNIPEVQNDLFRIYFHPVLNEETAELIRLLRKNHRVVCGTNTIESHWENHMERGDYALFDQTYASNKIGSAKPDENFFKLILEAESYEAKNAFFTDDKIENVNSAKNVGINSVVFESAEQFKNYLHSMNIL